MFQHVQAGFIYGEPCSERNTIYMSPVRPRFPKSTPTCMDITAMGVTTKLHQPELLKNVTTVYADHMRLPEVPIYVIEAIPQLELLDLSGNLITIIPVGVFLKTPRLHTLLLSDNKVVIPKKKPLLRHKFLHDLSLSNNGIKRLNPRVFRGLPNLKVLYLDMNKITRIGPKVFAPLKKLAFLHLGGNKLKVLPDNLTGPSRPRILITKGNPLRNATIIPR